MTADKKPPPTHDENEVLRRMLQTPPNPHKAPVKKLAKKKGGSK